MGISFVGGSPVLLDARYLSFELTATTLYPYTHYTRLGFKSPKLEWEIFRHDVKDAHFADVLRGFATMGVAVLGVVYCTPGP